MSAADLADRMRHRMADVEITARGLERQRRVIRDSARERLQAVGEELSQARIAAATDEAAARREAHLNVERQRLERTLATLATL